MNAVPITRKVLIDWAGEQVLRDSESMVDNGLVVEARYEHPFIKGIVLWNSRELRTSLKLLDDGTVESQCPCWANKERGVICSHVIALGVVLVRRQADPERAAMHAEETRRAARLSKISDGAYIQRAPEGEAGALPARLTLSLPGDWQAAGPHGPFALHAALEYRGDGLPLDTVPRDTPFLLSRQDESILFVLEDISEGPAPGTLSLSPRDFINVLALSSGKPLAWEGHDPIVINEALMTTHLRMDLDRENGQIILMVHTELPFLREGDPVFYIVDARKGWVFGAGNLWPLESVLPTPYHSIYSQPVCIPRNEVVRFLDQELPLLSKFSTLESDITPDLFTVDPATPSFRLEVRGSPASLSATLFALYGDIQLVAGKPDASELFGIPDPEDLMRYLVRNSEAEARALAIAAETGFRGERGDDLAHIVEVRHVLNFLGGSLPALRRRGWDVPLKGKVSGYMDSLGFATPVVRVANEPGGGWFDVGFQFEDPEGQSITASDIQLALRRGNSFFERNGKTVLLDGDAIESMQDVFSDCASGESSQPGWFRLSNVYAPFVKSSLDALDGIDVEDTPDWREQARQYSGTVEIENVPLDERLDGVLRTYQKEGVNWLRFLETSGFCGLLADEMGLGKTVQTLAWLQMERSKPEAAGQPALIVCPTSIVENWEEEAAKFTPGLTVLILTGPQRAERWEQLPKADIAITSYAILRRDAERFAESAFSIVVLDEAQHIKNRSTQNATAAKQIPCSQRLVLTGTPLENSVSDLWSIMDFLMPGYLGNHETFRNRYEMPILRDRPEGETARTKLRRKLQPFMMRRLKSDVARDLPPKIERVSFCQLTADQAAVYRELLAASQRKLADLVAKKGFNRCRMEVLATLTRLRQACCHLGLLKLPGLEAKRPSAKLDLFLELLDEALDSGHRILVFSQFVSMLKILKTELDQRDLTYCYLAGETKQRLKIVHEFNTRRSIPVFLISLKAGGTGLNLTGADMVIHFDPWWNPAVEDQATDRAYRIGQKRTVYSVKLITKGTVEEKVVALQEKKKAMIDDMIEGDHQVMQSLSWEDVQDLLSL